MNDLNEPAKGVMVRYLANDGSAVGAKIRLLTGAGINVVGAVLILRWAMDFLAFPQLG